MPDSELPPLPLVRERLRSFWRGWRAPWSGRDWLLLLCCPVVLVASAWLSERRTLGDAVLVGVWLDQVPMTGVSRSGLTSWLDEGDRLLSARTLRIQVANERFNLRGDEIAAHWDRTIVEQVMSAGRQGNLLAQLKWRLSRIGGAENLHAQVAFDADAWQQLIARWERASLQVPREAAIRYASGRVQRIDPAPGQRVSSQPATALLSAALGSAATDVIVLPLNDVQPTTTQVGAQAAEARARALLSAPIKVRVENREQAASETTAVAGTVAADGEDELLPRALGPALRSSVSVEHPGELDLTLDPEALDRALAKLRAKHERKEQNATFTVDARMRLTLQPSSIRTRIATAQAERVLWQASVDPERRGVLLVEPAEPPRITTEVAARLNIHELVSQYTTLFPCCQPRVRNISRIAELIDGAIVLPGETFSINEFVGPRTEAAGFVPAPTIVLGEMDDTIGGGVSQFATTLFNAAYDGGYEIIERQPHTYYFDRYPIGNDATLSIPKPDLIFKNDTRSGLLVKAEAGKTSIRVRLFGDKEGRRVTRSVTQPFDRIEPVLELTADDSLEPDKDKVEQAGAQGFTVEVTRVIRLETGEQNKQTRKVIYRPRARRVFVHSCQLPKGHEEYTGKPCPEPEPELGAEPDSETGAVGHR
jgi:vancomycin resistance protein YoaR